MSLADDVKKGLANGGDLEALTVDTLSSGSTPIELTADIDDVVDVTDEDVLIYVPAEPRRPSSELLPVGAIVKMPGGGLGIVMSVGSDYNSSGELTPYKEIPVQIVPLSDLAPETRKQIEDLLAEIQTDAIDSNSKTNW